ncbi:3-oxoacyl-ACP synthase III family protein [uncultured Piscinibacter sp.]|uniref:3-oxoacyl-ACP synthase III family protein n=1 Tax=uncultured Piscinibacter sp. TaxID=1131835 RepID=UPI00261748F7|nr:ketoacyl-ACP synthase III [uncultured Piscinibacter sp.]
MSRHSIEGFRIAGVSTCVPARVENNLADDLGFDPDEVRKVVQMAGVRERHVVAPGETAADLCFEAAESLLRELGWSRGSVSGLIFVTQSPDHFLPSTACLLHQWLGLPDDCAAFDMGLGCSGYPYGLYLAAAMLNAGGHRRVLMLHGETPSRFVAPDDQATRLLFSDAGSATALEIAPGAAASHFCLHTDGSGHDGLIIRGGAFRDRTPADPRDLWLRMDGAGIFNFTIKRVPTLIRDALAQSGRSVEEIDAYLFHQSNRFIMKHLMKKAGLPEAKVPMTIEDHGNCGGPSVALTLTRSLPAQRESTQRLMMLGYGVGLSWGAAVVELDAAATLLHREHASSFEHRSGPELAA